MSGFPQRANINEIIATTIKSRSGKNKKVSELLPWVKITSCLNQFLSLESSPMAESFESRYGTSGGRSGRIGIDSNGKSVYANDLNDSTGELIGSDRSYRSSPIINSISITQGNEGLSKKVNFTITAYSLGQAEALIQYFLEPATNVLVEWGFNVTDSVQRKTPITACDIAAYNNIKHITQKRKSSKGTYDAILGTVTGGNLSYGDNESYNIDVELTSIGELPAYLQHHRNVRLGDGDKDINNSSETFDVSEIKKNTRNDEVGKALFKQMFNDLPAHKRTESIKLLANESWATDEGNFVNMDNEIREYLIEEVKDTEIKAGKKKDNIKIPTDTPLFDDKRYIRLALAFTILDLNSDGKLAPQISNCKSVGGANPNINWRNTICRAFPNIFSANGDIMMIPNEKSPDFSLKDAIQSDTQYKNPIKRRNDVIQTKSTLPTGLDSSFSFPRKDSLVYNGQKDNDTDFECIEFDEYEWGYLKDLYINFDFFKECLDSSGYFTKDVYFKILNALSSSVNMIWDFQLIETGKLGKQATGVDKDDPCLTWWEDYMCKNQKEGDNELHIVCFNSTGLYKNNLGKVKFQSRGFESPFLSAELKFDIPSAMKGQIIGQKNSRKKIDPNAEQKEKNFQGLFTQYKDRIQEILKPLQDEAEIQRKKQEELDEYDKDGDGKLSKREKRKKEKAQKKEKEAEKENQQKSNYEFFARMATVVTKVNDRNADYDITTGWFNSADSNLDELMMVASWDDYNILKNVQDFNAGEKDSLKNEQQNAIVLPIKFNFTVHGVSGIKIGDTYNITDLPGEYRKKIFQVTQVTHNIDQSIWKTNIESMLVPLDAYSK